MSFKQVLSEHRMGKIRTSPMNLAATALVLVLSSFFTVFTSAQDNTQSKGAASIVSATSNPEIQCSTGSDLAQIECLKARLAAIEAEKPAEKRLKKFNFHAQYTLVGMADTSFSGSVNPAYGAFGTRTSLPTSGQARETQSADMFYGYRLGWDTELHIDALIWQGFGLNDAYGINDYPNGEAFKLGTRPPHFTFAKFFLRKTFNLDGKRELSVDDDQLTLPGKQDTNRIVLTLGKMSSKDVFDNNSYANDPREQFMNWALMANAAWDYPADALGFTTGITIECYKSKWALRYGWYQMSKIRNSFTADSQFLTIPAESAGGDGKIFEDYGMVSEIEHRHSIGNHPGAVRLLAFDDHANIGSYNAAVALANNSTYISNWCSSNNIPLASCSGATPGASG